MNDLSIKDGSNADLVSVAANAVWDVYTKSKHPNKTELLDKITALIQELAGEEID